MFKRDITYTDFDGNQQTETFYFNLSKPELTTLDVSHEDGMGAFLEKVVKSGDNQAIFEQFLNLILSAYGERSEDGKRFIKSPEIREAFTQTAAWEALFDELTQTESGMLDFIVNVFPADMREQILAQVAEKEKQEKAAPPLPPGATPSV